MTIDPVATGGAVPSRAQVVIVGGGVIGCSIAYHLAHLGWTDVVLLEQTYVVDGETKIRDVVLKSDIQYLDVVPSHIDLVGAEIEMINHPQRETVMKGILAQIKDEYDIIIIDCSPSLGLITVNALTAADSVIVPVQCEFFALEGLGKLLNTIKIVQNRLNPELAIEGILMTMYDGRLRLCNQVVSEVRRHFEELVFESIVHRNTRLSEAPSFGKPVILYDAESKGTLNYLNLAKEILQKNDLTKIKQEDRILTEAHHDKSE